MKVWVAAFMLLLAGTAAAQDRDGAAPAAGDNVEPAEALPPMQNYAAMTDADLTQRFRDKASRVFQDPCSDKVPYFTELARRNPEQRGYQGMTMVSEIYCAGQEGRFADGQRLVRQIEAEFAGLSVDEIALFLAYSLEDGPEILVRLGKLHRSGRLAGFPWQNVAMALATAQRAGLGKEADAFAYEVTRSTGFVRLPSELQTVYVGRAIGHAADTSTLTHVGALLAYVRSPEAAMQYLALRRYETIWPQVEDHAGDNLARLISDYVTWTTGRLIDAPEDEDRLSEHARALFYAGRYIEAAKLAEDWLARSGGEGGIREGDGWALNVQADALDELGRTAEADRVFDRLAELPADENPWVVNFVINRAARLLGQGRWSESLAATDLARPVAEKYGSPYARMLVASYRACAFHKLGRVEEGDRELEFVRDHFNDSPSTAGRALLCAGREDEAAASIARALQDDASRAQLIDGLQEAKFSLTGATSSFLPSVRALILEREDLRAEALKHVRLLPDRFVPITYLRREDPPAAR